MYLTSLKPMAYTLKSKLLILLAVFRAIDCTNADVYPGLVSPVGLTTNFVNGIENNEVGSTSTGLLLNLLCNG